MISHQDDFVTPVNPNIVSIGRLWGVNSGVRLEKL